MKYFCCMHKCKHPFIDSAARISSWNISHIKASMLSSNRKRFSFLAASSKSLAAQRTTYDVCPSDCLTWWRLLHVLAFHKLSQERNSIGLSNHRRIWAHIFGGAHARMAHMKLSGPYGHSNTKSTVELMKELKNSNLS